MTVVAKWQTHPVEGEEVIRQIRKRTGDVNNSNHRFKSCLLSSPNNAEYFKKEEGETPLNSVFRSALFGGESLSSFKEDIHD